MKSKKIISKSNFKIDYYVRTSEMIGLKQKPFEKKNSNILSTKNDWKTIYYFRKGIIPLFENPLFMNGNIFMFNIPIITNTELKTKIKEFIEYMKLNSEISGILVKKRITNNNHIKSYYTIEVWTTYIGTNHLLIQTLQKIFEYNGKIKISLFHPVALPQNKDLTFVQLRDKKMYLLRFDPVLTHKMYFKREWWEIFMFPYFKKYYRPNTNVIDIGGNVGTHTLLLSEIISPKSTIYVFEPVFADIIEMNVKENHIENKVVIYNEGVGDKNEKMNIDIFPRNCIRNFGKQSFIEKYRNLEFNIFNQKTKKKCQPVSQKIQIVTLDSKKITNVSILKIDVEGMEIQVLEGAIETITREKPVIFIEIWKRNLKNTLATPIYKKLIEELHYKIINIHGYDENDYILVPPN